MNAPRSLLAFALSAFLVAPGVSNAENWANWRGPHYNGSSDETGLPTKFSKTEKLAWAIDLPGIGASAPIVWGDAVFLTAVDEGSDSVVALRIDAGSGKVVWNKAFGKGTRQDNRSNYASPSAVTDGESVFFFSGSGDLAAFDFDGKMLWSRNLQKDYGDFAFLWTFSTSPALYEGKLYMQVLQRDTAVSGRGFEDKPNESYVVALDPATGEQLWRVIRPAKAVKESLESFSTPIPLEYEGRKELLVSGGDCLTGHDPATGKELWRWGTWNPDRISHWRLVPSPVYGAGVVIQCAPKKAPVYAVKAGLSGVQDDSALAWVSEEKEVTSDVPTPLFYEGRFYILNGGGKTLNCVDPATGKAIWSERLSAKVKLEASPTGADGKIYLVSHLGEVFVVKAGDTFELLHETNLGEPQTTDNRAPIVPAGGRLFVRIQDKLYCFAE